MTVSELWRSFQLYLFIFEVNRLSQKRRENQRKYHHTKFFTHSCKVDDKNRIKIEK